MLDKTHIHQIYEMTERQEKEIKQMIHDITNDIKYDFKKETSRVISKQKDPYLKEILDNLQSNSPLEQNYTASDILTVLETIFDEMKLDKIEEYQTNIKSIKDQDFTCNHCKNIISLESNPNLTKNDFNYCPNCGKPIKD